MADSAALRARRARLHAKGNHSLCKPGGSCPDAPPVVAQEQRTSRGCDGERGARLWQDMDGDKLAPGQRVLLEEACRIADRLDQLDALLRGEADVWARITLPKGDDSELVLRVDAAMSEARQHATALKQLVAELRAAAVPAKPAGQQPPSGGEQEQQRRPGGVLDITSRIQEKLQGTAG